ncbi:MAG: excinuclease ABC subunit UvrC [Muribaculaceae bacterium]|nr:excinuclease ABC subunit UvrC [Muribaculaceae bacterium]MDE6523309.1 excinuclease ABC subunit UvrC [Muribaculaceae bacterium]
MTEEDVKNAELLAGAGRDINEHGGFNLEIKSDRTPDDIRHNRPGEKLREKILSLPDSPGVYMYLDNTGTVIYVGKAKRLKRRVSSYFNRQHDIRRTNLLVRSIVDMRFIVVHSEEDALHLESAMIKEYQPRYNVLLKDDKSYPWIVVTKEDFPRVFMTREKGLGAKYYGPYSNVQSAKVVLQLIRDIFPLRSCRHILDEKGIARGKYSLCLDYHIKKCGGPCRGFVNKEQYDEYVTRVRAILRGETVELEKYLLEEMGRLSEEWKFEQAQEVKEKYEAVKRYNAKSVVAKTETADLDIFGFVASDDEDEAVVNFMHLHNGAVIQSINLEYKRCSASSKEEILSMAIAEVARRFERNFAEVIVPFLPDVEFEKIKFSIPQRGDMKKVLDVAVKNATQYLKDKEKQAEALDPERSVEKLMETMKKDFRLEVQPRHIECFDNSNIQGTNPVASCVVFRNGKPSKRDYRHFIIKTVVGADDFASMKEVLHRRYTRMMAEGEKLPDMVVVDGGKGQLSAAVEAFDEMGIRGEVALVGIAKRLEEIYFPGDSLPLYINKTSPSLRVIQAMRDEAHRFGITHHRDRRSKGQTVSELDSIKGIGPATKTALIKQFKSVKRIKEASLDAVVDAVGKAKGMLVYSHFHPVENQ